MPFPIILVVGLLFYSSVNHTNNVKQPNEKKITEVVTAKPLEVEPVVKKVKPILKKPGPLKEEVKVELKQPESIKEEVKVELKQPELVKEVIKEQPKVELKEQTTEEVKLDEPENSYLKVILYIIAALAAIFGGFYIFSSRGKIQPASSAVDSARSDVEKDTQSEPQKQQSTQEEPQTEPQEQQSTQEEPKTEPQEQQSTQEEPKTEPQEQQTSEEDENNNK
jgi:hypothetical protein